MQFQRVLKRQMDIWVSLASLVVFAIPFLVIAVLIKLESPGPVFFLQERLGKDGKIFRMFKFRSMVQGAAHMGAGLEVVKNDPRVQRKETSLRKTRFAKSPQPCQFLLGPMSLVAPPPATSGPTEPGTA